MNISDSIQILRRKSDREVTNIFVISFTILLYLFRTTIPFLKFPFILFYSGLIIYSIIIHHKQLPGVFIQFFRNFYIPVFLAIILIISFFLSNKLYLAIFKDVLNAGVLLSFFFILTIYVKSKTDLNLFFKTTLNLIIFFALIISLSLISYFLYGNPDFVNLSSNNPIWNSVIGSLSSDYNFALLPIFFGMIEVFHTLSKPISSLKKGILNIVLIIYTTAIIFSGSRRGFLILSAAILFFLFLQLFSYFKKNNSLTILANCSRNYLLSISIMAFLLAGFVFILPINIKRKTLSTFGISIKSYKNLISLGIFRYSSIFSNPVYDHLLGKVWIEKPDPYNPDSGWDSRVSTKVFPLSGENVNIVPKKSVGYKMDKTCNASTWNNNAYSYTDISVLLQRESDDTTNKSYLASVYCLVSEDFDGTWAGVSAERAIPVVCYQFYDLSKKGTWQMLQIEFTSETGIPSVYLYWAKYGVRDFSSLKGYVIYAYPQFKTIDKKESINRAILSVSILPLLNILAQREIDHDPIRNWASKFISEDTTYYGFKQNLVVDTMSNKFLAGRLLRWKFAGQIILKEYNWKQKIFGGGFNYLNWFGYFFLKDKLKSDWPHNPFLSILLYSGILGLCLYTFLLIRSFKYYLTYLKEHFLFYIFFMITFFFTFFSGGSPFDPPMMGFFVILPFFIHMVHRNKV